MTLVTCSKTGIEFEAKSKRQKNHPKVSELLADANKAGTYREALEACEQVKSQGIHDIDEALAIINAAMDVKVDKETAEKREIESRREYKKRRRQWRDEFNTRLAQAGYRWQQVGGIDEEEADHMAVEMAYAGAPAGLADAMIDAHSRGGYVLLDPDGNEIPEDVARERIGMRPFSG